MEFCQILDEMMKERGWSKYRLAKLMDCSQTTIGHWLAGDHLPQRATMKRLADVFGVSVERLQGIEKAATDDRDGALQSLLDDERTLLEGYRTMSEEDKKMMQNFMRRLRNVD